uniref:Uncharacterized protein n=1 Tax=Rhizophora mucronata TaxID=61149 RepID=A0A2P2N6C5_RHIMU
MLMNHIKSFQCSCL